MIAAWMVYAIAAGLVATCVAAAAERTLLAYGRPVRGIWAAAMVVTLGTPLAMYVAGRSAPAEDPATSASPTGVESNAIASSDVVPLAAMLVKADRPLLVAWASSSAAIALLLLHAAGTLRRRARAWRAAQVDGHAVLVTPDIGPAVIGAWRTRVLIPEWALALDRDLRRLMLRHESEHVRARDPLLLVAAVAAAAFAPWNPALWWQLRRLRTAVEIDCDTRVLRAGHGVARYGTLLLTVGARSAPVRLPAAALTERRSTLRRRIDLMTETRPRHRRLLAVLAVAVSGGALALACVGPRPDPAPPAAASAASANPDDAYLEFQTQRPARLAAGNPPVRYPDILRQTNVEGEVLMRFVVDRDGRADMSTLRVISSDHQLFENAVRDHLPRLRYEPALVDGRPVRMWTQQAFTFRLSK